MINDSNLTRAAPTHANAVIDPLSLTGFSSTPARYAIKKNDESKIEESEVSLSILIPIPVQRYLFLLSLNKYIVEFRVAF